MSESRQRLGKLGEDMAARRLQRDGYRILGRNFRTRYGEVDIVAAKGETIVFVEVRSKTSGAFGSPEESLTGEKREHLVLAAQEYLQANNLEGLHWRIDLAAVEIGSRGKAHRIALIENAVEM